MFVRGRRTTTEALFTLDGIVSATVVELESMKKAGFLDWLENRVQEFLSLNLAHSFRNVRLSGCSNPLPLRSAEVLDRLGGLISAGQLLYPFWSTVDFVF